MDVERVRWSFRGERRRIGALELQDQIGQQQAGIQSGSDQEEDSPPVSATGAVRRARIDA